MPGCEVTAQGLACPTAQKVCSIVELDINAKNLMSENQKLAGMHIITEHAKDYL